MLAVARGSILAFQHVVEGLVKDGAAVPDCPVEHLFAPGNYARQITMPAGSIVVGKIHRSAHLNFIMCGKVTVVTPEGRDEITAPAYFVSAPGTKRVVHVHEDTVWVTVHPTSETDVELIEQEVIASSFGALGLDVYSNEVLA